MAAKTWHYNYTSDIKFIGLMSKTQFISDVSNMTCDAKNWIKERISETHNVEDIATAKAKPGRAIKLAN